MSRIMEAAFWLALVAGVYPYSFYPMLAAWLGRIRRRRVRKAAFTPRVTVLIAAHNEAACIERTVRNKLAQEYPPKQLEVIVISDASVDRTDEILEGLARHDPRVRWWRQEPRAGKSAALNAGFRHATGEILVFADANSLYHPDALRQLLFNFADPEVGYVTGKMVYRNPDGAGVGDGCSAYMRFENWLRTQETAIGSVVGVDGGIDAVRSSLVTEFRPDQLPDFVMPLRIVAQNKRVVYDSTAILHEDALSDDKAEFRMRVRVTLRALWALRDCRELLSPRRDAIFAWQLWSHKLLRYAAFLPLLIALVLSMVLAAAHPLYRVLAASGIALLACAALGFVLPAGTTSPRLIRLAHYFVLINAAAAVATVRFLRGERITIWKPRTG